MCLPRSRSKRLGPDRAREIAEECYGEVLAYCRRHAPAGHDALDLAQETFLRFVRAVGATAPAVEASSFEVALWACPPFFLSCAGSLMALRKAHPTMAATLCVAWTAACSVALLALASVLPDLYANTSLAAWALAATAAAAWLAREAVLTLQTASAGLDAFSPRFARTHE